METLAHTAYVVMDKTGTLTEGVFEVAGVHHNQLKQEKILEYAALAECASSHPISKSLQKAYGRQPDRSRVTGIQEYSGKGVVATVDGHKVAAGNSKLMDVLHIPFIPCHMTGTLVHIAIDGRYEGHILIADRIKAHARQAVQQLKAEGVKDVIMLTGDAKKSADAVAEQLGIHKVYSELLPEGKVEKVEELIRKKAEKEKVAFVGDGINDAPVLSLADLGIANWSNPQGGYFISFNQKGCAKRIVSLCKEAGVVLTGAGASFPHGVDPEDENIRISPTFPTEEELQKAMDVFVCAAKLAAAEQALAK